MFGLFRKKKEIAAEPEKKAVSPQEKRIYVFDFDRTITILHTGAIAYSHELNATSVQKNVKKGFAGFVHTVINNGHAVYIASYSDDANADSVEADAVSGHDLIKFYMDEIFGPEQTLFMKYRGKEGVETGAPGNIIATNSQDLKQHHLDIILQQESLDPEDPGDMKRIFLLEDDEDVVRHYMEKGCTTIVPFSASRSADTVATKTLFTSYMPESFIA
jgi:hypothetical protein